jgi:glycerophosphoryl diester phosphodiesterase
MERFGHRGKYNNITILENTKKAFLSCIKSDFNGIEADVRLINDGNVVVFHDNNLNRVFKKDVNIENKTYEELVEYTYNNILLLQDLLEVVKEYDLKIILDIKNYEYLVLDTINFFVKLLKLDRKNISVILWKNKKQYQKLFKTFLGRDHECLSSKQILEIKKNNFDGVTFPYVSHINNIKSIVNIYSKGLEVNLYFNNNFLFHLEKNKYLCNIVKKITY